MLFSGVGGIEAEAVMLGQAISMVLPQVVGYKITGTLNQLVTSTDVVLTITKVIKNIPLIQIPTVLSVVICVVMKWDHMKSLSQLNWIHVMELSRIAQF